MAAQKEQIVLWLQSVKVAVWEDDEFILSVPNIRENYPRLDVGDILHFREVSKAEKVGTGRAVEARVVALRKREGFVRQSLTIPFGIRALLTWPRLLQSNAQSSHSNICTCNFCDEV